MGAVIRGVAAGAVLAAVAAGCRGGPDIEREVHVLARGTLPECIEAVKVLRTGGRPAAAALVPLLSHPDGEVRLRAAFTLGEIGPEAEVAVPELARVLSDAGGDIAARRESACALGKIGTPAVPFLPVLVAALADKDERLRNLSAWALGCVGPEAADATPALERLAADPSTAVRASAAFALGRIRPPVREAPAGTVEDPPAGR